MAACGTGHCPLKCCTNLVFEGAFGQLAFILQVISGNAFANSPHLISLAVAPTMPWACSQVIAKLLECRASPNGPVSGGGIGTTHPLSLLSINASSNPYAVEVGRLLVQGNSNINQQCKARRWQGGQHFEQPQLVELVDCRGF